jgi:SAM-dependent methyltransferase
MKIGLIPETLLERIALASGQVPIPIAHVLGGTILARTLMAAVRLGVFEALIAQPLNASEVAAACGADPYATQKLLDALVSSGYLAHQDARYSLEPVSRKWLLKDSPTSLYDAICFECVEWEWLGQLEQFIRDGKPLDFHAMMNADQWALYQRGMRAIAGIGADEVARRLPTPARARDMLDIGGSHGYFSVALCRRHPALRATVLDLPEAIEYAAPLLAREQMGDRVVHRAGNALTEDLGVELFDLVLISQLVHHFDDATNRALVQRVARALRPGGYLIIVEAIRHQFPTEGGQLAGLLDLYFAFTSKSGTWSFAEMVSWQQDAGLIPRKPIRFLKLPGYAAQVAAKPA